MKIIFIKIVDKQMLGDMGNFKYKRTKTNQFVQISGHCFKSINSKELEANAQKGEIFPLKGYNLMDLHYRAFSLKASKGL